MSGDRQASAILGAICGALSFGVLHLVAVPLLGLLLGAVVGGLLGLLLVVVGTWRS